MKRTSYPEPPWFRVTCQRHSCRSASIGSSEAVFDAGMMPNTTPTSAENHAAAMTTHKGTVAGGKFGIRDATHIPIAKPGTMLITVREQSHEFRRQLLASLVADGRK
ncbi:MAG: hypothetical protein IPK97_02295 [Ahniella sp.]|nr:hypothetical protein [Ahniella sp.]